MHCMPERTCDRGMIGSPAAAGDAGSSSAATVRAIRRARIERAMYPRATGLPARLDQCSDHRVGRSPRRPHAPSAIHVAGGARSARRGGALPAEERQQVAVEVERRELPRPEVRVRDARPARRDAAPRPPRAPRRAPSTSRTSIRVLAVPAMNDSAARAHRPLARSARDRHDSSLASHRCSTASSRPSTANPPSRWSTSNPNRPSRTRPPRPSPARAAPGSSGASPRRPSRGVVPMGGSWGART